jgi:hypothetical protein
MSESTLSPTATPFYPQVGTTWNFNNNGNGVHGILVSYATMNATGRIVVNCEDYFKAVNNPGFGIGPVCYLTRGIIPTYPEYNFKIMFGSNPTLPINGTIYVEESSYSASTGTLAITAAAPFSPMAPKVSIVGPQSVGTCETEVILDGSRSPTSDGRLLLYSWTVNDTTLMSSNQISFKRNILTIPTSLMEFKTYMFTLNVTNFMCVSAIANHILVRSDTQAPTITAAGGTLLTWRRAAVNTIYVTATNCGSGSLKYKWTVISPPTFTLGQADTNRYISFDAKTLPTIETTYIFQVAVTGTGETTSTQQFSATVQFDPLSVIIVGGDHAIASNENALSLTTKVLDPECIDATNDVYTWSCSNTANACPVDLVMYLATSPVNVVYEPALDPGVYIFTLNFTRGSRASSTSVTITVVSTSVPIVSITTPVNSKYAKSAKIQATATVSYTYPLTNTWTVTDTDANVVLDLAAYKIIQIETATTFSVVIYPNTLSEGITYELKATSADGIVSTSASVCFTINRSPIRGICDISSISGDNTAGQLFIASCLSWTSPDGNALTYSFAVDSGNSMGEMTVVPAQPSNKVTMYLPPGNYPGNTTILYVTVADSYGSSTTAEYNVTVSPAPVIDANSDIFAAITSDIASLYTLSQEQALQKTTLIVAELPIPKTGTCDAGLVCQNNGICETDGTCTCATGFSGTDCSLTTTQLASVTSAKESVIAAMATASFSMPYSLETALQQVAAIAALTSDPSTTSSVTETLALTIIQNIFNSENLPTGSALKFIMRVVGKISLNTFKNKSIGRRIQKDDQKSVSDLIMTILAKALRILTSSNLEGEPTSTIQVDEFTLSAQRQSLNKLNAQLVYALPSSIGAATFTMSNSVGNESIVLDSPVRTLTSGDKIDIRMMVFVGNPFAWANNAGNLTSSVVWMALATAEEVPIQVYNITKPITITIPGKYNDKTNGRKAACVYWNNATFTWESDGCSLTSISATQATCLCNHLTLFSVHNVYSAEQPLSSFTLDLLPNSIPLIVCAGVSICYTIMFIIALILNYKVDSKYKNTNTLNDGGWRIMIDTISGNHLWISTIFMPIRGSNYTRPQRITSLFAHILGILMLNAILYATNIQNMLVNGFISALLGLIVPNILGWLFSHIRVVAPTKLVKFEDFDNIQAVDFEDAHEIQSVDAQVNTYSITEEPQPEQMFTKRNSLETPPVEKKKSSTAIKIESREAARVEKAKARANQIAEFEKRVPINIQFSHMFELINDKLDSMFDTVEAALDCKGIPVGTVITSIIGLVLYYVCTAAIVLPIIFTMQHVWPMYLTDLWFYLATIYLILVIEFMYFGHKRDQWNKWAQWHVSKVVIVLYSIAILLVIIVSAGILSAGLGTKIWTIYDGLGHILTATCAGIVLLIILSIHLIVYISMRPKQKSKKMLIHFVNKFELPSWTVYIVYVLAYIYMIAVMAVTIALGYTRFNLDIGIAWLVSSAIAIGFDVMVFRVVGMLALGLFAPKLSELIKLLCFRDPDKETAQRASTTDALTIIDVMNDEKNVQ